jgi:hypothetical protein
MSQVKKWAPFAIGGVATLASMAFPDLAQHRDLSLSLGGASLFLQAVKEAGVLDPKLTPRGEMLRLLAKGNRDILSAAGF